MDNLQLNGHKGNFFWKTLFSGGIILKLWANRNVRNCKVQTQTCTGTFLDLTRKLMFHSPKSIVGIHKVSLVSQ